MKTLTVTLAFFVAFTAAAQTPKTPSLSKEAARQAWAQIDGVTPTTPVPTVVSSTTTGLVVEKEPNTQYPSVKVIIVTNHNGVLLVRANTCSGDVVHLVSTYYLDQQFSGLPLSWQVLDTRAYQEALPTADTLCSVEAFQQELYGIQRVAVANLQDNSPASFGIAGETFAIDIFGAKKSYILTLSGVIPQGSKAILGRDTIATSVVNGVATFPLINGNTGPTTVTLVTPDGTLSSVVYERKLWAVGCTDRSATNYGGPLPCIYYVQPQ